MNVLVKKYTSLQELENDNGKIYVDKNMIQQIMNTVKNTRVNLIR